MTARTTPGLALALALALPALTAARPDDKPAGPDEKAVKAWVKAGARVGWITRFEPTGTVAFFDKRPRGPAMPAFELLAPRAGDLKALPDPGVPFGLSLRRALLSAELMKEVAGLKNLRTVE